MRITYVLRVGVALLFSAYSSAIFIAMYLGIVLPGVAMTILFVLFPVLLTVVFSETAIRLRHLRHRIAEHFVAVFAQAVLPPTAVIFGLFLLESQHVIELSYKQNLLVPFFVTISASLIVAIGLGWLFGYLMRMIFGFGKRRVRR